MKIHMLLINLEGSVSFDITHWLTKVYLKHDILIKEIDIVNSYRVVAILKFLYVYIVSYACYLRVCLISMIPRCNMLPTELFLNNLFTR